jgi:hypothetical protein
MMGGPGLGLLTCRGSILEARSSARCSALPSPILTTFVLFLSLQDKLMQFRRDKTTHALDVDFRSLLDAVETIIYSKGPGCMPG